MADECQSVYTFNLSTQEVKLKCKNKLEHAVHSGEEMVIAGPIKTLLVVVNWRDDPDAKPGEQKHIQLGFRTRRILNANGSNSPKEPPKCESCGQHKWWTLISVTLDEKEGPVKSFGWACSNNGKGNDGKGKKPPCSMFKEWIKKETVEQDPE